MHHERRKGVALIIVLAILILVTALVVGFLVRTGSERTAAASYRATARTRQLADTVVNLVQAQINQATVATTGSVTTSGSAWASQPGAIRVFDGLGNQTIYKLYSSGTMVTTSYSTIAGDMPFTSGGATWMNSPSLWVDLNAPAAFTISGAPALAYPIIDPRNPPPTGGDFTSGTSGAGTGMAGFQVNPALIGGTASTTNPIAPMPAQWLYVLQDGTIVPPNLAQSTGTSVILSATNVSASNPIVGRVAFWTDDDTCRVNINTAGDGTFWDTPHYTASDEWMMAYYSPAQYEYQRYPGHPATTSLLPLLNAVTGGATSTTFPANSFTGNYTINLTGNYMATSGGYLWYSLYNNSYNPYQPLAYQNLFSLTPQYAYGGSAEATVPETSLQPYNSSYAASTPCPLNNQRLYSSVGELMYSSSNNGASPPVRYTNNGVGTTALLTRQQLETAKFFLTAHSRAPELNLFGTPRVSIWPFTVVNSGSTSTSVSLSGTQVVQTSVRNTAVDSLLAFASTLNENPAGTSGTSVYPYYFMRASNYDPYTDLSITRNGSNQNEQVLDYLDSLMSMPVPGFSTSSFDNKYSQIGTSAQTEGRQILAEIFDYIRTTDTEDGVVIYNNGANNGLGNIFGQPYAGGVGNLGIVVPTLNTMWAATSGTLEGFGTFPRPTCVMMHFVGLGQGPITSTTGTYPGITVPTQDLAVPAYANYDKANISTSGTVTSNRVAVQAYVYVQFVVPATARLDSNPEVFWITMTGLQTLGLTVSGTTVPLGFPSTSSEYYNINLAGGLNPGAYENDQFTGNDSIFGLTDGRAPNSSIVAGGTGGSVFAFFSQIITLPYTYVTGGTNYMILTGGSNVVMTLQDASPGTNVIQTVHLNFAQAAATGGPIPFPVDPSNAPGTTGGGTAFSSAGFLSIGRMLGTQTSSTNGADVSQNDRFGGYGQNYFDPWHDSAASLVLSSSSGWDDLRTLCVANVPASAFVAHQDWGKIQLANDFIYGFTWTPFPGNPANPASGTSGVLVPGAKYTNGGAVPCVESQSAGVAFQGGALGQGDWDNGVSKTSDGPWINRADEGGGTVNTSYDGWQYLPYFTAGNGSTTMGPGVFSPNREMPSPVMFGSLPTGVDPSGVSPQHWQCLLFRPGQVIIHPGRGRPTEGQPPYTTVPDHLLLDLFWMPVSEPYAISEPFSTAGKVNLNYQILPFGYVTTSGTTAYIRRDTGIRSALESLKIAGVPLACASQYKSETGGNWWGQVGGNSFIGDNGGDLARLPIDVNQTLQQFDSTFDNGRVFQSASEICDLYLVPMGYNLTTFASNAPGSGSWYGSDFALVGDNVRDRPYADIYSRITTKSNTFTVYFTVQELKSAPSTPPNQWNEATGTIVGEYRGSKDMERYIQQSSSLPNFLTYPSPNPVLSGTASLEPYYRWRIIEDNQFAP